MTIFEVFILALVEGFTEFLPISSTGHLILAERFLQITPTDFSSSFNIIIQFAAIAAVLFCYWNKIINSRYLWKKALIAFLPTGLLGFILYKAIKGILIGNANVMITAISLLIGGVILLFVDKFSNNKGGASTSKDLSIKSLLQIGLFQSLSMIPGVSRSAASIVGGLSTGLSRVEAVEFSFILAIPTMMVASGYDLLKNGLSFSGEELLLLTFGCAVAFISALVAVKTFTQFVAKNNFTPFAIYRIILAIVVFVVLS